ncbi:MAG: diguanylate cyclase [Pseudomonadota bacterium]
MRRSVFRNLLLTMLGFGCAVGLCFPLFAAVALDDRGALSALFFAMCVGAGLMVGAVNYALFSVVVSRAIRRLAAAMNEVNTRMATTRCEGLGCAHEMLVPVDSADALGETAQAFNTMIEAIATRMGRDHSVQALQEELAGTVDLDLVASEILAALAAICGARLGLLYVADESRLQLCAHVGLDHGEDVPEHLDPQQGYASLVFGQEAPVVLEPETEGLTWVRSSGPLGSLAPKALVLVPLLEKHRPVGLVMLASSGERGGPEARVLLASLAACAAPYLANAKLHQHIRHLAAIDDLTGLLNRRFGLRRLREEFSRSVRHGLPLSVIIFDIDHFKRFNDTWGHDAGDEVLRVVSRSLLQDLRAGDVLCRYGGEEFLTVAMGMGLHDAVVLGERLRRRVETTLTQWQKQGLHVTISLGLAAWPLTGASQAEELVSAADSALLAAKERGRNRLLARRGDQLVEAGELLEERRRVEAAGGVL